jgi:hypothetical protein
MKVRDLGYLCQPGTVCVHKSELNCDSVVKLYTTTGIALNGDDFPTVKMRGAAKACPSRLAESFYRATD